MAGKKRRRPYTFMSQMPRSNDGFNELENDTIDASTRSPLEPITEPSHDQPSQVELGQQQMGSDETLTTPSGSAANTPNVTRKKGRGPAIGYQGKEKIKIIFNKLMQPIGDSSTDVANILGEIAKCGARAPLDIVSWKLMPATNLEIMWKDVQAQSIRNAKNRSQLEFLPRTGRTSHANIREEMKANNEDTSHAEVFIKTRTRNDGTIPDDDTKKLVDRFNEKLSEIPQSEQNDALKEQVFIDLLGPDGHGRVRTFGTGPSPRDIFGARTSSKNTSSFSDEIKKMVEEQVEAQLETRVAEKLSRYKETQVKLLERIERMKCIMVLGGLCPESSPSDNTHNSGSSDGEVQTLSNPS